MPESPNQSQETPEIQNSPETSRRDFVKLAGAGLALAATSQLAAAQVTAQAVAPIPNRPTARPLPELEKPLPNALDERVGFAVLGLGKLALNQILPNFENSQKSKLVAVVSGDTAKAQKIAHQYNLGPNSVYNYQNFDTIKNNPAVQVVYVITPNSLHREFVERAAPRRKKRAVREAFRH